VQKRRSGSHFSKSPLPPIETVCVHGIKIVAKTLRTENLSGQCAQRSMALFTVLITTVVGKRNVIKRSYVGFTTCSQGDATFGGGTTWTVKIREDGDFGATLWSFYISQPGYFHS